MDIQVVQELQNQFDALSHKIPDEDVEFWFARELQAPLGYARWENFMTAISRAIESCKTTGSDESNHFRGVTKMVKIGSGPLRTPHSSMIFKLPMLLCHQ